MSERGFLLDPFQVDAMAAIDARRSVLVAAPTGAGKTVLAEHAIEVALADGERCFYTSPIKALANQKFRSFRRRYGTDAVGLLTGDNSIAGDAPIVVMTTEVLRNMLYEESRDLETLGWVVLDEVHYLQDKFRGPVWEEVILYLDPSVRIVGLSATVSNLEEITDWLTTVRGPTELVATDHRPVPLFQQLLVRPSAHSPIAAVPLFTRGRPNPEGFDFDVPKSQRYGRQRRGRGPATPRRTHIATWVTEQRLAPTIYYIFSRAGCDDAVRQCRAASLLFTTPEQRHRIDAIIDQHLSVIDPKDQASLQLDAWRRNVRSGFASHHAGLIPACKEAVEQCFAEGLITIVFATETLALGINMPARSVVLESMTKYNGEDHVALTPLEYTQLIGRAGRRGLDDKGESFVVWSPRQEFDTVVSVAGSTSYPLRSAFRPTYNMVANLAERMTPKQAQELLGRSLAQFHVDRSAVAARTELRRLIEQRQAALADAQCERGDVAAFLAAMAPGAASSNAVVDTDAINDALIALRPGEVLSLGPTRVVVLSATERRGHARVKVVDEHGRAFGISTEDFWEPPDVVAFAELPVPYRPNAEDFRRDAATALRDAVGERQSAETGTSVAACPDFDQHRAALERADKLERRIARMEAGLAQRSSRLLAEFEAITAMLADAGYLTLSGDDGWSLTGRGDLLASIYNSADLLIAEAIRIGVFDGLNAQELAAVLSGVTYEARNPDVDDDQLVLPTKTTTVALDVLDALARDLQRRERTFLGASRTPSIDRGFALRAFRWANDKPLSLLIDAPEEAGSFVRDVKQLVDLCRQLADLNPARVALVADPSITDAAAATAARLDRGVVRSASVPSSGSTGSEGSGHGHDEGTESER